MKYIESKNFDPYFNLALEEFVFEKLSRDNEYFMLWQNDNTIVVGKYQNTAEEINQDFVDNHDIKVVRRLSGGGAVYHDMGNLNFTFIVNQGKEFGFDFKRFADPVINALSKFGINAVLTGRNDITIDGKKISGNSQYIKHGRIMSHGCIMVNSNVVNVADALRPKPAKFVSKKSKSVHSRVTTIDANSKENITVDMIKTALINEMSYADSLERYELTEDEVRRVNELADEKYRTWDWNYGNCADYGYKNCIKYDFGMVEVSADIKNSKICDIEIHGDFFGSGNIHELEEALIGQTVDAKLGERLGKIINVNDYIEGMSSEDIQFILR